MVSGYVKSFILQKDGRSPTPNEEKDNNRQLLYLFLMNANSAIH